ncbi:hypothetical protein BS78_01G221100 [Paspalum vaginatum]|nr:hypothetical protein BS78_01G221100 [Paspalum vaginatum]
MRMMGLQQVAGHLAPPWTALPRSGTRGRSRRKMAVARLGGSGGRSRCRLLGTALRRLRLRWVAALCRRAVRRQRAACANGAAQRVLEGAALVGAVRLDAGV